MGKQGRYAPCRMAHTPLLTYKGIACSAASLGRHYALAVVAIIFVALLAAAGLALDPRVC